MFGLPEEAEAELAGRSAGQQQQQQQQPALTLSTLPQQSGSPSLREPHAQVLGSPRGRRMSNGRRRGAVPRPPPSATVAGGASGLSPAMEEDHNLAVTLARDTESGSGAPEAGLSPFLSRPASFSVLRRPTLSEARPGAVSARAPPPRRSAAATTSACPAPSAYDDDCRANLYHRLDATPPNKRRRVAADPDVVDLTADSPVVVGTPERPSTRGSEVEVVGFRAPPSEEVQVVDTREPIDSLWHSLTTSPTRADHSSRAYRRRPIRMGSRRSGPSVYGPTSSGVVPPDSALRCGGPGYPPGRWDSSDPRRKYGRGGPGGGAAAEGGMDRDSKELAEMLQEEEDRFAALSAYRHDVDLHARLEELHAQETQAQRERWNQSMQNYTRSRIAETLYRHSSIPSRDQLREQLRESMMGHSASRHAHLAGGYGWNRGHHSSAALASPGFGDLLFGGAFPPMQQLHYLSHQVQAIRQVREGRLPAHMLLSDRDFDENDYEALLALDEGVENRKGATESVINQLPTEMVAPSPTKAACVLERCTVCLEDPQAGEVLRSLPCHHKFHKHCIDKWLGMKASCPICLCDIK